MSNSFTQVLILDSQGTVCAKRTLLGKTLACGAAVDCDVVLPLLPADQLIFVRQQARQTWLLRQDEQGQPQEQIELTPGKITEVSGYRWLTVHDHRDLPKPKPHVSSELLSESLRWLHQPMQNDQQLRASLKDFIHLIISNTSAEGGMLVLANGHGFELAVCEGIPESQAAGLWEKMPDTLVQDILKHGARIILPEILSRTPHQRTTVFLRNFQSYAGFPVLAEGRVVGIFYLYFTNLVSSLDDELQEQLEDISSLLGVVIQRAHLRRQIEQLMTRARTTSLPESRIMIGSSRNLGEIYRMITRLAPVSVPVLVRGETGTGKELVARELHRMSNRSEQSFVVLNAAAFPENLIEAELFGYKKGAFTGAISDRVGLIEQAHGGTLFIDEIGEMPVSVQAKLLRVLQEKTVLRVGDTVPRQVDFRLLTATHRDLLQQVQAERFREDLYYRIAGAEIVIPPLRERRQDIIPLANFFKQRFCEQNGLKDKEWSSDALEALELHPWPGNVRELEHAVNRAFVMADGPVIGPTHLNIDLSETAASEEAMDRVSFSEAKDAWIKNYIMKALNKHNGKRAETAKYLGIGQRTLFRYIEQYEIKDA